ncbi:MAG: nitroreductase family protein [Clostridiales bacterium]|nr:nitroreductase family protein [Clostridiales bacterium]
MSINAIYNRRSIRKYKDKAVAREDIAQIIDAGRQAPSAKNRQPWKCIVFENDTKKELLECMERGLEREYKGEAVLPKSRFGLPDARHTLRIMRQAPVLLIILNTNGTSPFLPIDDDKRVSEICDSLSIGAFIQNMLLEAQELGLGTLWIANTCFAYPELVEYLQTEEQLIGAVALGYPDEKSAARPRKELEEIVEWRV